MIQSQVDSLPTVAAKHTKTKKGIFLNKELNKIPYNIGQIHEKASVSRNLSKIASYKVYKVSYDAASQKIAIFLRESGGKKEVAFIGYYLKTGDNLRY